MVIAEALNREIVEKRKKISGNPEYYLKRSQRIKGDLRRICDIHSFWLETPSLRGRILQAQGEIDSRQLRKIARKSVANIKKAWKFLNSKGNGDFLGRLSSEIILKVGKFVEPSKNAQGYRNQRVTLGLQYVPPNPVKVPELVEAFCCNVKDSDYSPVEAAAVTHLTLTGIQPFQDGNKRTARLLQDRILFGYGLPPAVILSGEREVYIDLLEQGLWGLRDRDLKLQRPFFDYIGGKVNVALDKILDDLNPNKRKCSKKH